MGIAVKCEVEHSCVCVVAGGEISGVRGHAVDLDLTPIVTWSGPGDRKLPQQGWRCLQEIYWHWDTEIFQLSSPSITHWQARTHVQKQSTKVCVHGHACTHKNMRAQSAHTHKHTLRGDSRVESAGETETLWPFNSQDHWTGQDHTHWCRHTHRHKKINDRSTYLSQWWLTLVWNYCLHNLDPLSGNFVCMHGDF